MDKTTDSLQIEIDKAREGLTKESRAAIDAVSWKLIISGMNKKFNPEQLDFLEMETELLLCGLESTTNYTKELESGMKISRADVGVLINELDKLIFKKIQEELENRLNGGKGKIVYKNKPFVVDPRFINLPKELQEAISYSNWKERMYDIAKKFKLNIEQTGLLEEITIKVILNTIHTDQYEGEIRSKIDLGDDKIKEMVTDLNENIFKNIKQIMENASASLSEEKKIPAPPYVSKKEVASSATRREGGINDVVPLPPVSSPPAKGEMPKGQRGSDSTDVYKEEKPAQKEIEDIISNKGVGNKESDMYREHGIEIISEDEVIPEIKKVENKMPSPSMGNIVVENTKKVDSNIIADKLFGNTTSKTTVSDYSLPKISNDQEHTHDPYHEAI
ncbi:MAG: hypothetical protein WCW04_02705 [Candidatus Paceibacterota bacterium]